MSSTHEHENGFSKHSAQFKEKGSDLGKGFQDLSKITGALAGDVVHHVQENASQYYDQGIKQAKKFEKGIESRIQKHPLQSVMIMAGVGLLLGTLWNRR